YMFMARVMASTLPVRSPLPKRQHSTRWAPASTASSASATPQPRSLWGW
ncbi:FeoB-associated Cys-rich membrane protein, partial [Dysosmobacter welbionis]